MKEQDISPAELALRDAAREYHRSPTRGVAQGQFGGGNVLFFHGGFSRLILR